MKNFKIISTIPLSGKNLFLLNQPFEKTVDELEFRRGRLSTYHEKEEFKADWMCYPPLPNCSVLICTSDTDYTFEQALMFMARSNGLGLSRDNLFMLFQLYYKEVSVVIEHGIQSINAPMGAEFLPEHLSYSDRKICPSLAVEKEGSKIVPNYDWDFIDEFYPSFKAFAFIKINLHKRYF